MTSPSTIIIHGLAKLELQPDGRYAAYEQIGEALSGPIWRQCLHRATVREANWLATEFWKAGLRVTLDGRSYPILESNLKPETMQ